jgi:hypothetical protein
LYSHDCDLSKSLIIVPFRDQGDQGRGRQLEKFIQHYSSHDNLHILIVEQSNDKRKFNRGALLNAGYLYAQEHFPHIDTFLFHDVDIILPSSIINKYYGNCDRYKILHLGNLVKDTKYNPPFGRVIRFSKNTFHAINGFPNNFYGWGGEDDALAFRIHINDVGNVHRPVRTEESLGFEMETDNDVKSSLTDSQIKESKKESHKWENIALDRMIWKINGINSLQFKTNHYHEHAKNVHHINVDLSPQVSVEDLFHSIVKNPTHETITLYQQAYTQVSSMPEWKTLDFKQKQKQIEETMKQLQLDPSIELQSSIGQEKEKEKDVELELEKEPTIELLSYTDNSKETPDDKKTIKINL